MKNFVLVIMLTVLVSFNNKDQHRPQVNENLEEENQFDRSSFIGQDYILDDQHSYIGFRIKYFGFSPVRGRFNDFNGTLFYSPSSIVNLSVTVAIDVNSINTGNERRDDDLKREGTWFDATTFPKILFKSKEVVAKSDDEFDLKGILIIKGMSKEVTISFERPTDLSKDWAGNDQVDFSGKLIINRQDFEIFGSDFWNSVMENGLTQLSDEVEIELDIHCRKADYQFRYDRADSADVRKTRLDMIKEQGIELGLENIDGLFKDDKLSSGILSTIGHTLNTWKMHDEAAHVFIKRKEYYPEKSTSWNQLGITELYKNDLSQAQINFESMLYEDSNNTQALEYIKL
ncbi:MAG: YceI family protein, partial [Saprospiraceae bacterium]|nr:YceI family protein [Saprospiraceae bacterium]